MTLDNKLVAELASVTGRTDAPFAFNSRFYLPDGGQDAELKCRGCLNMILNDTVAAAVDGGASVSLASVAADGQIDLTACSASTTRVIGMTLPGARGLMSEGILSNTILPALGDTPLPQAALKSVKASLAAAFPFNRKGLFNREDVLLVGAIRMALRQARSV